MKKFISVLAFLTLAFCSAQAAVTPQRNYQLTSNGHSSATIDSFTSAANDTFIVQIKDIRQEVAFQVNVNKYSGTVAGSIKVYASIDAGAHYAQINSTYTITDGSQTYLYPITGGNQYSYYMVVVIHSTGSAAYNSWLLYR